MRASHDYQAAGSSLELRKGAAQPTVYNERMGLTPKRVQRVLDQWDATTASTQESWFNFQMLLFAVATIVCLVGGAWWLALMCAAITLVCFQVLWERPGSRARRLCDALMKRN